MCSSSEANSQLPLARIVVSFLRILGGPLSSSSSSSCTSGSRLYNSWDHPAFVVGGFFEPPPLAHPLNLSPPFFPIPFSFHPLKFTRQVTPAASQCWPTARLAPGNCQTSSLRQKSRFQKSFLKKGRGCGTFFGGPTGHTEMSLKLMRHTSCLHHPFLFRIFSWSCSNIRDIVCTCRNVQHCGIKISWHWWLVS